jgi:hypothetical protein
VPCAAVADFLVLYVALLPFLKQEVITIFISYHFRFKNHAGMMHTAFENLGLMHLSICKMASDALIGF